MVGGHVCPRWFILSASLSLALSLLLYLQIHFQWFGPRAPGQLLGSVLASLCALMLSVVALVAALKRDGPVQWPLASLLLLLGSGTMLSVGCMQSIFVT